MIEPPDTDVLKRLRLYEPALFQGTQELSRYFFHLLFKHYFKLTFNGRQYVQALPPCIIAPTHFSHLDFWAVLEGLPKLMRQQTYILAAADHFYASPLRRFATRLGSYHNLPFDRRQTSPQAYRHLLAILESGLTLLMFPQGSRSRNGQLQPFNPLLSMLAIDSGRPILPVVIRGTFEAFPPGRFWPRARLIAIHFGEPIDPATLDLPTDRPLHQRAKQLNHRLTASIKTLWETS